MILMSELCTNHVVGYDKYSVTDILCNLSRLHYALNFVRRVYDRPLKVTSGYRTWDDHQKIYERMKKEPPKESCHLIGAAADILDLSGYLKQFLKSNCSLLQEMNLYCEDFDSTPNWVHFQIYPPRSGKRFFKP